jgi:hypothetical protein
LFSKAQEKEIEQRAWELWLAMYPTMTKETFISYDEMLNMVKHKETKHEMPVSGCYVDQVFF